MNHDWLLVETLSDDPAVVATGVYLEDLAPLSAFIRRRKHLAAVRTAITETVQSGQSLTSITPKRDLVIRTVPVVMSDDRVHGVHLWTGPADEDPPERPVPGPLKWDLTLGVSTDTRQSLINTGKDPDVATMTFSAFTEDRPARPLNANEATVLAPAMKALPGQTVCSNWDITDAQGEQIRVAFVARSMLEPADDGQDHLIARAILWRSEREGPEVTNADVAQRIVSSLSADGVHRALVDLDGWGVLRWIDDPCPFLDFGSTTKGQDRVHPDDHATVESMKRASAEGPISRIVRLRGFDGEWVPVHVNLDRVPLGSDRAAGRIALRLPSADEIAAAGL